MTYYEGTDLEQKYCSICGRWFIGIAEKINRYWRSSYVNKEGKKEKKCNTEYILCGDCKNNRLDELDE